MNTCKDFTLCREVFENGLDNQLRLGGLAVTLIPHSPTHHLLTYSSMDCDKLARMAENRGRGRWRASNARTAKA
jgi:hypothetical protein